MLLGIFFANAYFFVFGSGLMSDGRKAVNITMVGEIEGVSVYFFFGLFQSLPFCGGGLRRSIKRSAKMRSIFQAPNVVNNNKFCTKNKLFDDVYINKCKNNLHKY